MDPTVDRARVAVAPLKPSNCGFDGTWSEHFRTRFAGQPLKAVVLSFTDSKGNVFHQQGEFIVTETGVEGSLIYAFSAPLRDEIEASGRAVIRLDLAPGWTHERLVERLSRPRGSRSMASHLEKSVGIKGVKAGLLWEFVPKVDFTAPNGWLLPSRIYRFRCSPRVRWRKPLAARVASPSNRSMSI